MLRITLATALVLFSFITSLNAQGVTIIPTYDATISANATAVATLNAAIAEYAAKLNNPGVVVRISFQNMGSGLGQSNTFFTSFSYTTFRNALIAHSTTADDASSLLALPAGANSPVPSSSPGSVVMSLPNARALGLLGNSASSDSTIGLNLSLMNFDRTSINPAKYDLKAVAQHEIDEVLGTVSDVGGTGFFASPTTIDHMRFGANGVFSFTTNPSASAYFSVNSGATNLVNYNQSGSGDYGDFIVNSPPHVQDFAGTPGTTPDLNVELRMLDVVGWNLVTAVPEPTTIAFIGLAGAGTLGAWWHRRRRLIKLANQNL
ncbi:MAG TPA: NF038122 family metalloprotease [Gemmatales bacterium]|nr:NF038122 family metalloprotease [Gemmatales bacterium]